jgi:hypothetical protein
MSKRKIDELAKQVMSDEAFRKRLLADPEGTLKAEGYDVTPDLLDAISNVSPADVEAMAREFESSSSTKKAAT